MEYVIEEVSREQTAEIYKKHLERHFPPEEVKPLKNIYRMWDAGAYRVLGMYKQGEKQGGEQSALIGYAFFAMVRDVLLLDYFAVLEPYRGQGLGSLFLRELREKLQGFTGLLIETEDAESAATEEELYERRQRDIFYERNGARRTGIRSEVYGVHYAIWDYPIERAASREECREQLTEIYRMMLEGDRFERFFRYLQDG